MGCTECGQQIFFDAEQAVAKERRCLSNEREAFQKFKREVEQIELAQTVTPNGPLQMRRNSSQSEITQIKDSYESTVMSVPHYADDYNETYPESLFHEFGPEIASALVSESALTPRLKQILLSGISESLQQRERLIETVKTEQQSLNSSRERMKPIQSEVIELGSNSCSTCSFGTLEANHKQFQILEKRCLSIVESRQRTVVNHQRKFSNVEGNTNVLAYLYSDLDIEIPVVASIAKIVKNIKENKQKIEHSVYNI